MKYVLKLFQSCVCKIRDIDVICDHSDWWFLLSLCDFGFHVKVLENHIIFAKSNICVVKEEGDTLHMNQSYEQKVARDKNTHIYMRLDIDTVGSAPNKKMGQWQLIVISIKCQSQITKEGWIY